MDANPDVRERLIEAGVQELREYGVQGFSLRRVAQACGLSCAAPYKHFKDKQDLLQAVADKLNEEWFERQAKAIDRQGGSVSDQLRTICREYLRYLRDNPTFCTLIALRDDSTGKWRLGRLFDQSSVSKRLIVEYAMEHHLSDQEVYCRVYSIRALMYGAAMMNQQDDMRMTDPVLETLFRVIDEQF